MTEFATYIPAYNKWVSAQPVKIIQPAKDVSKFSELPPVSTVPSPFLPPSASQMVVGLPYPIPAGPPDITP